MSLLVAVDSASGKVQGTLTEMCASVDMALMRNGGTPPTSKVVFLFEDMEAGNDACPLTDSQALAIMCGIWPYIDGVRRIVSTGRVDVDQPALVDGLTPLDYCARKGNLEIAQFLLAEGGASPSAGRPVLWACYTNKLEVAKALVALGCPVDVLGPGSGGTPLHFAAENNALECVRWLVEEQGVCISACNPNGQTALQLAAQNEVRFAEILCNPAVSRKRTR